MRRSFLGFFLLAVLLVSACRGKKEATYVWKNKEESRTLTLLPGGSFVLEIQAGYYNRIDTGTYVQRGDTLILNSEKPADDLDSLVVLDSLYNNTRFMEVYEEEVTVNNNQLTETFYRLSIFPTVTVNGEAPLSLNPDDQGFHELQIPDDLAVSQAVITRHEENTCRPFLKVTVDIPPGAEKKSYRVYLRSRQRRENYLAGFKWLIHGNKVESFFQDDDCHPKDIKLIRR